MTEILLLMQAGIQRRLLPSLLLPVLLATTVATGCPNNLNLTDPPAKTVTAAFKTTKATKSEPTKGTKEDEVPTYTITVSVTDPDNVLNTADAVAEVIVNASAQSTAVEGIDYKWVKKPDKLTFTRDGAKEYELVLKILDDKDVDVNEKLLLTLTKGNGTRNVPTLDLSSTHTLTILDNRKTAAIVLSFPTKADTLREPLLKSRTLHTIQVKLTDTDNTLAEADTQVEAEVVVDAKSTAVENVDYKWINKPKLVFKKDGPTEYQLALEVLQDQVTDTPEILLLNLKNTDGTANLTTTPDLSATYSITILDNETLPNVPLSIALGTNLNVIDKETSGSNIYLDVMAFQLNTTNRGNNSWNFGGYVRGYQQQGTSSFEEAALTRFGMSNLIQPVYAQLGAVRNDSTRVDRTFKRFTPKAPTVRSSGAVLSIGINKTPIENATSRLQINSNLHLEWVRREIAVDYDEQILSRDTVRIPIQQLQTAPPALLQRRYTFVDWYIGVDLPILYQCKIAEQNLGFKVIPSTGVVFMNSTTMPSRKAFYFSTYVTITEYKHGFTLGFDTKNIMDNATADGRYTTQNLGFSIFAVKMFNLSAIGNLFGFAEQKTP